MRGYDRVDEDLDEYEDEFEDQHGDLGADQYEYEEDEEEEEEEEEAPIPEEKLRYLDLRQKLKEEARSKLRKENGESVNKSQDRKGVAPSGRFGSFFGPSRPVIADRVIQESKSFLETRHLAAKQSTAPNDEKKVTMSTSSSISKSQNGGSNRPLSKQVKSKAQVIRQTRDFYSSLLADDAEPKPGGDAEPKPGGDAGPQKNIISKTDARSAQVLSKSREPLSSSSKPSSSSSRKGLNGYEQRKPSSGSLQPRAGQTSRPQKPISGSRPGFVSPDSKRQLDPRKQPQSSKQPGSSNGIGPARSAVPKVLPPKKPLHSSDRKVPAGAVERKASNPVGVKTSTVAKNPVSNGQRIPPVKSQTSVVRKPVVDRRDVQHMNREGKMLKKENMSASKYQTVKPPKQEPARYNAVNGRYIKEQRPSGKSSVQKSSASRDPYSKKRRAGDAFSDDEIDYRSVIRGMFGRPRHYEDVDDDDDDMCMEVGFDAIQREEIRSAKIAKREDDEELVKIMEEERQEKLRKQAKLRKKQQQR